MALLKFKRSAVPAKIPSIADLALGELAINTYDGKVYTKKDDGTASIVEVGGSGGITTITSADGSVTVTGSGATRDLSVAVAGSTTNVVALVRNNTGATLAKGTVVYINGSLGQNSTVAKAIANSDSTSAQTLGLMTANLANNATGYVTVIGVLTGMDTSAFTDGQQLYLSPTTAGTFTATKPYAPQHLVYVAVVEHAHPSQGKLFVKVQNGYEMDELHDVSAQNPANNDGLFYNTTSGLWEKKSIATALGYTPYNATNPSGYTTNVGTVTSVAGTGTVSGLTLTGSVTGSGSLTLGGAITGFLPLTGGTLTGALTVPVNSGTTGGGINFAGAGSTFIRGTSGDGASSTTSNLQLQSWFGIGFGPSITGQTVPVGENAVWIDCRAGTLNARTFLKAPNTYTGATGRLYDDGNFHIDGIGSPVWINSLSNSTIELNTQTTGYVNIGNSARAPIYYDSANTAYYIDAASNSVLNTLTLGGRATTNAVFYSGFTLDANTMLTNSTGFTYALNAPFTGPIVRLGHGAYDLFFNAPYSESGYALAFRTQNGDTATNNPWRYSVVYDVNRAANIYGSAFYDSNNTAFFFDGASTTNINTLSGNNKTALETADSYLRINQSSTFSNGIWLGSSHIGGSGTTLHLGSNGDSTLARIRLISGTYSGSTVITLNGADGIGTSTASWRAPIFYDSNDTGYYINPNGDSNLSKTFTYLGGKDTNANWNTGFQNTPPQAYNFHGDISSGGPAGTWWFYESMRHSNASNYWGTQVAWGWEDNERRLLQRNVSNGTFSAWVEYLNTSGRTYSGNLTMTGSIISSASDVRAPIFYDQNSTGYYVDPNSNSVLYSFDNINQRCSYSRQWENYPGISVYNTTDQGPQADFRIFGSPGANGGDFSVRLLVDGDIQTLNALRAGSLASAPIYYDSNNSGYYLDPNGGSYLNGATFTDLITGRNSPSTDVNTANDTGSISIRGSTTTVAAVSFHRAGAYAINMGLGTDNVFRIGGWSASSNAFQMDGSGNLTMLGNVTAYSDARLKKDVLTVTNALELVSKMRGVTYTRIDTGEAGVGVIAQEMLEVMPQVVQQGIGEDDTLSVAYGNLVGVLIEAIKELRVEVETLKNRS